MVKFFYSDGENICLYDGEKSSAYASGRIESYKRNAESAARSAEWKRSGEGAIFRGDASYRSQSAESVSGEVCGVYPIEGDNWVVYSYKVGDASGIYKKNLADGKTPETHVINSGSLSFGTGMVNTADGTFAVSVQRNYYNADIGVFDLRSGDYKLLTDGDTFDTDPFISEDERGIIYFASRGVGRDMHGNFSEYAPSVICKLDTNRTTVEEVVCDPKNSYFKPVKHGGKLYAIKAPVKDKQENAFISFLLLPWRILQAIANLINIFVHAMTGKSAAGGGDNPTAARDYDSRKIEIEGNLIDMDKQIKRNASKRNPDFGFVPNSWKLVEVESGEVIKSGVCDFDIAGDGTIIATNGRRVFAIKDGKCRKVCNAEACLHVSCKHTGTKPSNDLFSDF